MVKKLIAGILGRKEEDPAQAAPSAPDVPDELPPLAEDMAAKTEEKSFEPQAVPMQSTTPIAMPSSVPDELPSIAASSDEGTLMDLEPGTPIPDAIRKAKMAKLKETLPAPSEAPKPSEDFSARERIKSGNEIGFFTNIIDHIQKNEGAKDKLLSGDLFVRMDNYWDMRKHEIKSGKQIPAEKKLEDDLMMKLQELRALEQKWQVQKLSIEEDLKYLHEREREIQAKIKELRLVTNELNLYKNVKPDEYFYMKNGIVLKNLHDLVDVLEIIDDDAFAFHVNPGSRNDFSDWVRHVYHENNLADKLKNAKTKMEMIEILESIPIGMEMDQEKATSTVTNPKKYFWLSNGSVVRSLYELSDALKIMDDELFEKHVNAGKNDFSRWVTDVLKNEVLGQKLGKTRSRREMITLIEAYL